MDFSEKAAEFRLIRKDLGQEIHSNKPSCHAATCYKETKTGQLEHINNACLVYAPVDTNTDSPDAQLVHAGIWTYEDCGTLFLESPDISIPLARINPKEKVNLALGWITEKGEVILKGEQNESSI